jgi:hypothetical protein
MDEPVPYIIFLPSDHSDQITLLTTVFGSEIKLEILREFCSEKKIYQKNLIEKLPYSNKTLIRHLKDLVNLKMLGEEMEKKESTWLKVFTVTDSMRWLVLLLRDPDTVPANEMKQIIKEFLQDYIENILKISEHYNIGKKEIYSFLGDVYEDSR